ncbi:hypothetical protein P3X46_011237 [Hevea brasiliensis]|uniref:SHSP domain-containing protein n=1 Tax=Hevea brasiliensis TaxID=3981 RepID=A0ABQ9MGJ7_HEVBR|nr:17.4 kDa class III heat shock protein [Hevea brasiliensis]KAJ9179449.1 hypothetical protein P3X46_011237 [Hevea brasiliensis]
MSRIADSNLFDAMSHLFNIPESIEKFMIHSRSNDTNENKGVGNIPTDILDSPKEYIFYMDAPGLCKSDIQVTVEDENTLVIKSGGKRKREEGEEEGCKYIRLERRAPQKLMRKFRLPENANVSAITAKCENGVLTVVVEKHPPPPKAKKVEVTVS